ncbi:hypothetical protein BDV98DRAFT_297944 [Pterulicium gracile]|uniref:DUF7598 domain-containing protein n=1 Tax=Pterulicium gracile TaxID=1884261 RepID=A0A5C3Q973_9AGAR|nr:hypothetical protein BDV98DRAFT_297944 [Pterula gracilis]
MLPPRAYVFIGLNIVRVLSMVGLLLVFASSIVVLVHDVQIFNAFIQSPLHPDNAVDGSSNSTAIDLNQDYILGSTVPNQSAGIFWAILNRLLIIFQVIFLFMSECSWPMSFFDRFFPVLGMEFGTGALGIIECLIGAAVLSHRINTFALVSAFFLFSIGCVNMLVGLIWRQHSKTKRSITSWRNKAKDVLPTSIVSLPHQMTSGSLTSMSMYSEKGAEPAVRSETPQNNHAGMGFGRQGEKAAALKGFMINKPVESLPRYAPKRTASDDGHEETQ